MDNNTPPNDPYNPQAPQGYNPAEAHDDAMDSAAPSLGGGKGKVIIGGAVLVIVLGFIISSMFETPKKNNQLDLSAASKEGEENVVAKAGNDTLGAAPSVSVPPPPSATLPPPPAPDNFTLPPGSPGADTGASAELLSNPPPLDNTGATGTDVPPPPAPPAPDLKSLSNTPQTDEKTQARIRSNMLIIDGNKGAAADNGTTAADNALNSADPNRAFSANVLAGTGAQKATATRLNNLNMTIAQGKIVNAVLETAINTDLPGTLRAIVSRDTYAEAGHAILIPKGSRLLGTYNTGVVRGQNRVMIIWTRLIRPDGVDIAIGSSAVDGLGRAGIEGFVDNKYMEIFSAAVLTTALSLGAAKISDKLVPSDGTTTTNTDGSTTSTNSASALAAGSAVADLASTGKSVVNNLIDMRPTITIDQGTRINVFVNKDLTFPDTRDEMLFVQ